ncbi:hypothetical protein K501DRAFT_272976 [Backusella circina FSU 941]|nr:hypothetical protein K501DRAFT_272976 [Backusella circina FSU 941]
MSSCQDESEITKYTVDRNQRKGSSSKMRCNPAAGSSSPKVIDPSYSAAKKTTIQEKEETSTQNTGVSVPVVKSKHESSKELSSEVEPSTPKPGIATRKKVPSPPVKSVAPEVSKDAMNADELSPSETESTSPTISGDTILPTNVDLKSMILDCYSMLTKEEENRLAKELPIVDLHNGGIRPDFFDDSNSVFWDAVRHWRTAHLESSETDLSTHSSRHDTICSILNKYATRYSNPHQGKRKLAKAAPEKKISRIRFNPPRPQNETDTRAKHAGKSAKNITRRDVRTNRLSFSVKKRYLIRTLCGSGWYIVCGSRTTGRREGKNRRTDIRSHCGKKSRSSLVMRRYSYKRSCGSGSLCSMVGLFGRYSKTSYGGRCYYVYTQLIGFSFSLPRSYGEQKTFYMGYKVYSNIKVVLPVIS